MSLIQMKNAYLSFGTLEILNNATLYINENEKICLIGKNGAGKSTLLNIIKKKQDLDRGDVLYKKDIQIAFLQQKHFNYSNISVYNFIINQLKKKIKNNLPENLHDNPIKLNIDHIVQIEKIINTIKIEKNTLLSSLSGGLLRKVIIAGTLVQEPDILLLDEPTNHLDIETIQWLEKFLKNFSGSVLFVSHDRSFIQNVSTRIIDLDRGKLISWPGNYKNFLILKKESNRIETIHKKLFDHNLDIEEKWIKKGIKARCTRNEGRIKKIKILRETQANYKKIENIKNININQIHTYIGKIIFKLKKINIIINNKTIIRDFSETIQNGDKIGLIGNNGCGKSTLIKVILGQIQPNNGQIYKTPGTNIAYFDQNRATLNPNKSILDNIDCGQEKITLNGKEQYLIGYLKKFLFQPNKLNILIKTLSGGECNRLLLARLFLKPSNVLILDEPTNDLDLDTLELLEKIIIDYTGTVIIVSHDRKFIKNTVNKYWVFRENGNISSYLDNYKFFKKDNKHINISKKNKEKKLSKNTNKKNKYNIIHHKKNKKDINLILHEIEKIELKIKTLQNQLNQPNFFKKPIAEKLPILEQLQKYEKNLQKNINNWESLEKSIG
ncbi:ATP-binding cassette domain-containing protein [Buchnera aphidicola]|uniref:ATP-binding cassette domain-containing protein n=1 Tax=Buchnera aphidicola TaxID=9 RepID=UPI00346436A0